MNAYLTGTDYLILVVIHIKIFQGEHGVTICLLQAVEVDARFERSHHLMEPPISVIQLSEPIGK